MIKTIHLVLSEDGSMTIDDASAGFVFENNATTLSIAIPEAFASYEQYIDFKSPGMKCFYAKLSSSNATSTLLIPSAALDRAGIGQLQWRGVKDNVTIKSKLIDYAVSEGINASVASKLVSMTITANGAYSAADYDAAGFSSVIVNVK